MVQGIKREKIFGEDRLKRIFIKYLKESVLKNNVDIIAYCVMPNHAHILIYTEDVRNLTKVMHSLNTRFAKLYNKVLNRCGYVFRDRYRCENIMTVDHLKCCIRYIHNNPVKAGFCEKCSDYNFSSFNDYLNENKDTKNLQEIVGEDLEFILNYNQNQEPIGIFLDVDNEFAESSKLTMAEVVESYCMQKGITKQRIDKIQLAELVKLLINKYGISKIQVQKELNISKYMIYKIIKN